MREYPFDTEELVKGSRIDASLIEHAYGVKRDHDRYRMAQLKAKEFVVRRLLERGLVVTVKCELHDLVILTEEDASPYNEREVSRGFRKAVRAHGRMLGADRSELSPTTLARHDRVIEANGRGLSAFRRERRLAAAPRERQTPVPALPEKAEP
jgi:hypothetical protein